MKHSRPSTRIFGDVLVLALQITGPLGVNVRSLLICVIHLARTNDDFPPDPNADLPGLSEMYRREAYRGLAQVWVCGQGLISLRNSGGGSEASVTPSYRRPESIHRCSDQVLRRERMPSNVVTALALSSFCKSRRILSPSCSSRIALPCSTMSSIRSRTL